MQTMTTDGGEHPTVAPADGTAARRYFGKYAALVTDNAPTAQGIQPGTIEVQIPGLLEEGPSQGTSAMASVPGGPPSPPPPNQAMKVLALPCFLPGFFFIPENQAPVWVEFVAGDINFPIWTGVWYPSNSTSFTAPLDSDGSAPDQDEKVIRTPSGQVIHLSDASGSEKTVIKDEKNGNTITLSQDGINIEASASGKSVTLTFGQTTAVVQDDSITLTKGQSTVTLKADSVEIDQGGSNSVKLDSSGLTINAPMGATIGGLPIVLQPLYDWITQSLGVWITSHVHTGNLGAPTSPPLVPPVPPSPLPTSLATP